LNINGVKIRLKNVELDWINEVKIGLKIVEFDWI